MKTYEVIETVIADKKPVKFNSDEKEFYKVTEGQFNWVCDTYRKESGKNDLFHAVITDLKGNYYEFSSNYYKWHAPVYIPNYKQYKRTFYIKIIKNKKF